jgi:hypothetical protein
VVKAEGVGGDAAAVGAAARKVDGDDVSVTDARIIQCRRFNVHGAELLAAFPCIAWWDQKPFHLASKSRHRHRRLDLPCYQQRDRLNV